MVVLPAMQHPAYRRAQLLSEQQRPREAIAELQRALRDEPDEPDHHALLGQLLAQAGDHREALAAVRQAVALGPEDGWNHFALGRVHLLAGRLKPAAQAFRQAIQQEPQQAEFHGHHAHVSFYLQQHDRALRAAEEGLRWDPTHTLCLNVRARVLAQQGRAGEAEAVFAQSLGNAPEDPFTHLARGQTQLQQGEHRQAMASFREALRLDARLGPAQDGLLEALRAHNPLYRGLRRIAGDRRWQGVFTAILQVLAMLLVAGLLLGGQVGDGRLRTGALAAWISLLVILLGLRPLSTLIVLLHPLARHALSPGERNGAWAMAVVLLAALATLVLWAAGWGPGGWAFVLVFALLLPLAAAQLIVDAHRRGAVVLLWLLLVVATGLWLWAAAVRPEGSRHAERVDWLLLGNLLGCAVVAFARPRRRRVRPR